jgi:3-hydroxyisobutyrate dehydrogenase-like beta-hydroxyacid dehydrogenase
MRIGFIGLGKMGSAMARNLLRAGHQVAAYNRSREKAEALAGFALKLALKDMRLALETAGECAAPMPLASLIRDHFLSAMAHGQAELDWSSMARVLARNAGL